MAGEFTLQISKFQAKTEEKMRTTIRYICLEISRRVIMRTPVATGRARGSWTPSLGSMQAGRDILDKDGSATVENVNSILGGLNLGDTFYLTSNLPYMAVLEYGRYPNPPKSGDFSFGVGWTTGKTVNGFSRQAPQGMVRVTLAEFPGVVEMAARST